MTNGGQFSERVSLQKPDPTASPDASGNIDLSDGDVNWTTVGERWAKFANQAGREFFNAAQITADLTHMVDVFYDETSKLIDSSWRLKMTSGRYLNILSALDISEQHKTLRLLCREST